MDDDGQPRTPRDPAVATALERLRARDEPAAETAAAAWGWVAPEGEVARVHQRLVQDFVWYRLPVKWFCDHDEHLRTAAALGELLDELGLPRYAQLCRSATTREVIAAWDRGSTDGRASYRRALSGSGIEPPDSEALTWGAVMGVEEFEANNHVAITLERAVVDGVLVPGARGWRALQRQLTVAALGEQVPEHPGAQDWRSLVTTARMVRWIEQHRSPRRRQLIGRWETRLLHPTEPPPEVASVVAPLRRLLSVTGGDMHEAVAVFEVARNRRWVRRQGRTLTATRAGRAIAADEVALWRGLAAAMAAPSGFEGFVRECVLLLLLDAEQLGRDELSVELAELAVEAGYRNPMSEDSPTPEVVGPFADDLLTILTAFCLLVERDVPPPEAGRVRLTDAGRATALEMLRMRATGPQHRLLD